MKEYATSAEQRVRLLQKVVRDTSEEGGTRTYRYDLLANCAERGREYVIRAHMARTGEEGEQYQEAASIVRPIYGRGSCVREIFLDVAYADQPVDPVHLGDVLQDRCAETDIDEGKLQTDESLSEYYRYDKEWRRSNR